MYLDVKAERKKITFLRKIHTKNIWVATIGSGIVAIIAIYGTLFEWIVTMRTFPNLDIINTLLGFIALNSTSAIAIGEKWSKKVNRSLVDYLNAKDRLIHLHQIKRDQEEEQEEEQEERGF